MAWADVEWSNLDTLTEAKLDQMQANLDYVREVMRSRVGLQEAGIIDLGSIGISNWVVRVKIGTYTFDSATISGTAWAAVTGLRNKDVSGLTAGVQYAITVAGVVGSTEYELLRGLFIPYADGGYLSAFANAHRGVSGGAVAQLRGTSILFTRDNEGF